MFYFSITVDTQLFLVCNIVIRHLYNLQRDHCDKSRTCSERMSNPRRSLVKFI